MKRDNKLTHFMAYGGSYTSVLLSQRIIKPALLDFSVQCPGPAVTNCVQCLFIGPGLLIRHPLFYDFTVADL